MIHEIAFIKKRSGQPVVDEKVHLLYFFSSMSTADLVFVNVYYEIWILRLVFLYQFKAGLGLLY